MEELQQEFSRESISTLEDFQNNLAAPPAENYLRELFRALHTIKGNAQTFGFDAAATLAHEIENLLQAAHENTIPNDEYFSSLLGEGIAHLKNSFALSNGDGENSAPPEFIEKIRRAAKIKSVPARNILSLKIPLEFLDKLSAHEQQQIAAKIERDENVFLIEVGFDFADFETEFKHFKNVLNEAGETLSSFPSSKFSGKIGFQIFFAGKIEAAHVWQIIQPFDAEIVFQTQKLQIDFPMNLKGVFSQTVAAGKYLAAQFGKEVAFEVSPTDVEISPKLIKILSEILLHIVRNAIDHGIETRGAIKISCAIDGNNLRLVVADDGRGIDAEKVRAKAVEKNLIRADEKLSREEILNLIFAHGFSTAEKISEVSGRGVGLDVVAETVKKARGEIFLASVANAGTTFNITFPIDEKNADD